MEKYGLRKEKAAEIYALNIRLFYDPTSLKRVPETITFADLVSNYNLLVHSITSLSLQRYNDTTYKNIQMWFSHSATDFLGW